MRLARLARVLRFYADKAHRHGLQTDQYRALVEEIDRMVKRGGTYTFASRGGVDRGWVFCPEFDGDHPQVLSQPDDDVPILLFGPAILPDTAFSASSETGEERRSDAEFARTEASSCLVADIGQRSAEVEESGEQMASAEPAEHLRRVPVGQHGDGGRVGVPSLLLGTDVYTGEEVRWTLTIHGNPHLLVGGLPGMGKTTCLANLCRQTVAANVRPIVLSYHEDMHQRLEEAHLPVRFVDFQGLGFNPLEVTDRQTPQAYLDVAGTVRDIFVAIFPELGDLQGEQIRRAIRESFRELGWDDPAADPRTLEEPPFGRFVEILRREPRPSPGLRTLLDRLEELEDYGFFRRTETWTNLWDSEGATVVRIHRTQNDELQRAFASLVLYGLYKQMFRRGPRPWITHAVILDEAHRAARLQLLPTFAKECRKFGISLVLASQEARDFHRSLFSAVANYLVLRLNEPDAKALVRNVATSDDERRLVDRIKQRERFQALCFLEGRRKPSLVTLVGA